MGRSKVKPIKMHPTLIERGKVYSEIIEKLEIFLKYWFNRMSLDEWNFDVDYEMLKKEERPEALACVYPSWEYQQATLKFFLPNLAGRNDLEIEKVVVHELSHLLVHQMEHKDARIEDVETCVVNITRTLMKIKYDISSKTLRKK